MPKIDKSNFILNNKFREILAIEREIARNPDGAACRYIKELPTEQWVSKVDVWQNCVCWDDTETFNKFRNALFVHIPEFRASMLDKSKPILCGNGKPYTREILANALARIVTHHRNYAQCMLGWLHKLAKCDWSNSTNEQRIMLAAFLICTAQVVHDIELRLASSAFVAIYNAYAQLERQERESLTDTHTRLLNKDVRFRKVWCKLYLTQAHKGLVK